MSTFVGETNKIIRVNGGVDLSANTDLRIDFRKSCNVVVSKSLSASEITIGTVEIVDQELEDGTTQTFLANQYVEYRTEAGFLDVSGYWEAQLVAINTVPTPNAKLIGDVTSFMVEDVLNAS